MPAMVTGVTRSSTVRYSVSAVAVARAVLAPGVRGAVAVRSTSEVVVSSSATAPTPGAATKSRVPDGVTASAPSGSVANSAGRSTHVASSLSRSSTCTNASAGSVAVASRVYSV